MQFSVYFIWNHQNTGATRQQAPVRIAVAGITHGHVTWILSRNKPDVTLAGIYEPDNELAQRRCQKIWA